MQHALLWWCNLMRGLPRNFAPAPHLSSYLYLSLFPFLNSSSLAASALATACAECRSSSSPIRGHSRRLLRCWWIREVFRRSAYYSVSGANRPGQPSSAVVVNHSGRIGSFFWQCRPWKRRSAVATVVVCTDRRRDPGACRVRLP